MADQFENQLPQKSDAKWVRALDASGNPILISKEDLASVVGGLMSFPFEYRGRIKLDANRITDSGFYYADGQSSNVDNHIGPFLNFKADQGYIQFVSDIFSGSVYVRSYILSGSSMKWTDWHSIF
ncbi:hypothetical protein [Phocaeicola coprophilus]